MRSWRLHWVAFWRVKQNKSNYWSKKKKNTEKKRESWEAKQAQEGGQPDRIVKNAKDNNGTYNAHLNSVSTININS